MSSTATGTRTNVIDPSHSSAHFSVRHLMISKVRGAFKTISGTITLPESGPIPTAVEVTIDAASIDTNEPQRDGHLKSADFLDIEKYPTLSFTSTAITPIDAESFSAAGTLDIHGVKQPLTVTVNVGGQGKDPMGNERIAYEASFKVNRKDHGIEFNMALEAGGVAIGDQIDVNLDIETIAKPA